MKILAIWGSPRRGGNTDILLKAFVDGATQAGAEVERIALRELKISPCQEIYHCFKDGTCPIKDDMLPLYDKLLEADVVALASPIFFYSVTAQAKAFIDRTQALWARRYHVKIDFPGPERQGVLLAAAVPIGFFLHPVVGLLFMLISGFVDTLDGLLARRRNVASVFGAFLDSTLDRIPEQLDSGRDRSRVGAGWCRGPSHACGRGTEDGYPPGWAA